MPPHGFHVQVVAALVQGMVLLDITLILMNRFHYTMDCFVAVAAVMLRFQIFRWGSRGGRWILNISEGYTTYL